MDYAVYGTNMKTLKYCLLILFLLSLLLSCTREMPDDELLVPDEQQENVEIAPINRSLYEDSGVFQNTKYMKNLPGILLVCDQTQGATLYYVNKESEEERIYCFDPLCKHGNCVAYHFYLPRNLVYHPYDDAIYGTTVQHGLGCGTELYRIDPQTQEIELVWQGNGNDLDRFLYAYEQYVFFVVENSEKGYDIMRYDAERDEVEQMAPPNGKAFMRFFYIQGEKIIVRFMDEKEWYQTYEDFSQFISLGSNGMTYFDQERAIQLISTEGEIFGFRVQYFGSEQTKVFFESDVSVLNLGYDGKYVYYAEYIQAANGSFLLDEMLYRVCVDDGEVEQLCPLGGTPMEVACYDGNIYYHVKKYSDGSPDFFYGKLIETESGFVAEDFDLYVPPLY